MASVLIWVESGVKPLMRACGFRKYRHFAECADGDLVSRSGTSQTRRLVLGDGARRETVYLKVYRYQGDRWRHRFRRHKGAVEARNYRFLRRRCGVRVPDVLAYGGRRAWLWLRDAFILTRAIDDAAPLEARLHDPPPMRRRLMREVARAVARMHAAHFYHADLQWRNILVRPGSPSTPSPSKAEGDQGGSLKGGGEGEGTGAGDDIFVLDSSRGGRRYTTPARRHGQVRDLSSLDKLGRVHLSRADRMRWLKWYLEALAAYAAEAWPPKAAAMPRSCLLDLAGAVARYARRKSLA
jgi:hypothetical protein